jgi:predicted nucleic acid-binding protein
MRTLKKKAPNGEAESMNNFSCEQKSSGRKILLDTNIIIDYLQQREGFFIPAEKIINSCRDGNIAVCVTTQSITDLFYILRKDYTISDLRRLLSDLCEMFIVIGVSAGEIKNALGNPLFDDFEDCVQSECALSAGVEYIVTRNHGDYGASHLLPARVYSPRNAQDRM